MLFRVRLSRLGVLLRCRRRSGVRSGVCGVLLGEAALVFGLDGFVAPVLVVWYMVDMACTGDIRT